MRRTSLGLPVHAGFLAPAFSAARAGKGLTARPTPTAMAKPRRTRIPWQFSTVRGNSCRQPQEQVSPSRKSRQTQRLPTTTATPGKPGGRKATDLPRPFSEGDCQGRRATEWGAPPPWVTTPWRRPRMHRYAKYVRRLAVATSVAVAALVPLAGTAHGADAGSDEAAFIADTNAARASAGVAPLTIDSRLTTLARSWSATMAAGGRIWHNPDLASQAPSSWRVLGENVGVGGTEPVVQQAFINSPHHYTNMVDPRFTTVGIGVTYTSG